MLDFTNGELGALLARLLKGKKHIKAVLIYKPGTVYGISDEDLVWNGGNIYPVEIDKSEDEIDDFIKAVFQDSEFTLENGLTVANTTNICRLMAQIFFYPYSFSRIKEKVNGDIYYAVNAGNYATLMAGLYSWRFALPVAGFFIPSSPGLMTDSIGNPILLDSFVNFTDRQSLNPVFPANLERLEAFFGRNQMMMKHFIYPVEVSEKDVVKAAQELFMKYGLYVDERTARSYATIKNRGQEIYDEGGAFVLISQLHPGLNSDFCRHVLGDAPDVPELVRETLYNFGISVPKVNDFEEIKGIIKDINR